MFENRPDSAIQNRSVPELTDELSIASKKLKTPIISHEWKFEADLEERRLRNEQREEMAKLVERWVLALKIDWSEFHRRHSHSTEFPCDGTTKVAKRILKELGLDKKAVEICLEFFTEVGGGCDCEIAFNLDMTDPEPRCDLSCHDCGNDFDEYYMVHDHIWSASGLSEEGGMLCVGCLEQRIGRQLCRDDFPDWEINRPRNDQSLRLQDRLRREGRS